MGLADALVAVAAAYSPGSSRSSSPTFPEVLPATAAKPDPGRPAKKQRVDRRRRENRPEREAMPPECVKEPGKRGQLNPIWRKSFPRDQEAGSDRGKVVQVPPHLHKHGEWRRVPGFWKILASDLGYIMTEGVWVVRTPSVNTDHYLTVKCNGKGERVHLLVARAFKGRPTPDQVSVDHKDRNESNNCEANLEWATPEQQRANQGDRKANSDGEPCLVWQVVGCERKSRTVAYDTTVVENTMERFPSLNTAGKTLGLSNGTLSMIFNGKTKTVANADGKRYTGKWDPDLVDLEGEEWKEKEISSRNRLFVSNYGRLQRIYPGGRKGTKHYPESSDADGYLKVKIDNQKTYMHMLVGELFFIGPKPRNWFCFDHKDLVKQNNHIGNLRPVTVEDNGVNTARQRDFFLWPVGHPDDRVRCVSQRGTARAYGFGKGRLGDVLHKRVDKKGYVCNTVGGYCAAFCDEVD